jgi:uncharacterized protein (TIGR03643 family)
MFINYHIPFNQVIQIRMKSIIAKKETHLLNDVQIDRIIEMAWEDRTPFEAVEFQFGLSESDVKALMKRELRFASYIRWRRRVEKCRTKHAARRTTAINRFKCSRQRTISNNKISKR